MEVNLRFTLRKLKKKTRKKIIRKGRAHFSKDEVNFRLFSKSHNIHIFGPLNFKIL
jgi:hypothetical protein